MQETDGSSKPPQISEMFQKFALAFKSKTFEFFADIEPIEDSDGYSLLDSAEEVITDQKVVVIKPDPIRATSFVTESAITRPWRPTQMKTMDTQMTQTLISSIFATVASFEASYFQLQTAHVPFVEESVKDADRALVSHLQRMSEFKQFYKDFVRNPDFDADLPIGSCLEAQVQENQSKLRTLGTFSNRLQVEIDQKDNEVLALKKKLGEIHKSNLKLSKRLSGNFNSSCEVLFSVRVFDSVLHDACRAAHRFTKILIELMTKAMWDLDLAANTVYLDIEYAKKRHNQYAFLSYVCLGMFRGFDLEGFGLGENEIVCNGHVLKFGKEWHFFEAITRARIKQSYGVAKMASSIWTLHKLAFSFDPVVEIFQVERGVDFSMVYMEDITRRCMLPGKTRAKVGFTVVPGFKIGRTIIQAQAWFAGQNLAIEFHEFNIGGYKSKNACVTTLKKETVEIHTHRSTSCYAAEVGRKGMECEWWNPLDADLEGLEQHEGCLDGGIGRKG
uniref:Uncharacterized protein n=1 Tax=Fagus sylvatica TaxID=28930 RepID=A0A2N9F831_FAGSY